MLERRDRLNMSSWALVACILAGSVSFSSADIIDFDDLEGGEYYGSIPKDYGSTDTIAVSYRTYCDNGEVFSDQVYLWGPDYADLHNVAVTQYAAAEITFAAKQEGDLVRLDSFEMGGYASPGYVAGLLRLLDGEGSVLADWAGTEGAVIGYPKATVFTADFAAPTLVLQWGYTTEYAVDNIHLSVVPVPIPGAVLLGMLGLGAAGMKLRKMA